MLGMSQGSPRTQALCHVIRHFGARVCAAFDANPTIVIPGTHPDAWRSPEVKLWANRVAAGVAPKPRVLSQAWLAACARQGAGSHALEGYGALAAVPQALHGCCEEDPGGHKAAGLAARRLAEPLPVAAGFQWPPFMPDGDSPLPPSRSEHDLAVSPAPVPAS